MNRIVLESPKAYKTKTPDYDALWKKLIEALFKEFMQFFAPDLYREIDFSKPPHFLKQEFHQLFIKEKKGKAIADEIVEVFLKNGDEKWILIHIEVQGKREQDFGKRMFRYFYRIYDKFNREIYAIALLTDNNQSKYSTGFHYDFYGTKIDYTYNVYKFDPKHIDKLEQSANPFAAAVIAGIYANQSKNDAVKRYMFKRKLIIQILQKFSYQQEDTHIYLSALFYFIDYLLQIPDDLVKQLTKDVMPYLGKEVADQMRAEKTDTSQTLSEIFAELKREGIEKGMERGVEKGKKEALSHVVRELIREDYSDEQIGKITKLEIEEVKAWRKTFEM